MQYVYTYLLQFCTEGDTVPAMTKAKPRGRPCLEPATPRNKILPVRFTEAEMALIKKTAVKSVKTLTEFVRERLLKG
jgi:hypothetical protein